MRIWNCVKIAILMGLTGKDEIECQNALEKNKENISLASKKLIEENKEE